MENIKEPGKNESDSHFVYSISELHTDSLNKTKLLFGGKKYNNLKNLVGYHWIKVMK